MDFTIEEAYKRLADFVILHAWKDARKSKKAYESEYREFLEFTKYLMKLDDFPIKYFEKEFKELCMLQDRYQKERDWFKSEWCNVLSCDVLDSDAVIEKLDKYGKEKK